MGKAKKKTVKQKIYNCPICAKKFSDNSGLNHHMEIHTDDRSHVCPTCGATFKTKRYLSRHNKRVHCEPEEHECNDCGKKFHFKSALNQHRLVHTDERPYKCKWCNKGFNSTYSLSGHILIHKNLKPFKCRHCDYACRDGSTLRKHEKRHVGEVPTYNCKICEKKFCKKKLLEFHVAEEHLNVDVKVLPCGTCGKMFRDNASLKLHVNKIHKRLYAVKCAVCGVTKSCKQNMAAHLRSHLDERPFTCTFEGCAKAFKDSVALRRHEVYHYPERYVGCEFCEKSFANRRKLNVHKRQHVDREKCVVCDYCGVGFYSKKYLVNHIAKKHLNTHKFVCATCAREFGNKPGLIRHISAHSTEMEKQCRLCNRSFKRHAYLKLHYWNTHCIKYKTRPKPVKTKTKIREMKPDDGKVAIKTEPTIDAENTERSKSALMEDLKASGRQMDIFYDIRTLNRNQLPKKREDPRVNKELQETVNNKIQNLLKQSQRVKARGDLERARRRYNERIEKLMREEPQTESTETEIGKITCEMDENGKLKFNAHQCYVCFTVYKTKDDLLDHCQQHFDVCTGNTLRKCPLCDHVSHVSLGKHLLKEHKIKTKLYTGNIKNNGTQYYFDVNGRKVDKLHVIPSVRLLNRQACLNLDKINREKRDQSIAKKKLVKRGEEWIVEKEKLNIENYKIPKLSDIDSTDFAGDHCTRMKTLSDAAKQNGGKMLYPCDRCEKVCQTLSALKLHYRRHDNDAKPFKPKVWKHKLQFDNNNHNESIVCDVSKRYVKAKPVTNKHRCNPELIKFYESNISGDNIEFGQFLKIFNRMTRENIKDFSDLENRTDFGIQPVNKGIDVHKKGRVRKLKVIRHVLISSREYQVRNKIKERLRQRLHNMNNK